MVRFKRGKEKTSDHEDAMFIKYIGADRDRDNFSINYLESMGVDIPDWVYSAEFIEVPGLGYANLDSPGSSGVSPQVYKKKYDFRDHDHFALVPKNDIELPNALISVEHPDDLDREFFNLCRVLTWEHNQNVLEENGIGIGSKLQPVVTYNSDGKIVPIAVGEFRDDLSRDDDLPRELFPNPEYEDDWIGDEYEQDREFRSFLDDKISEELEPCKELYEEGEIAYHNEYDLDGSMGNDIGISDTGKVHILDPGEINEHRGVTGQHETAEEFFKDKGIWQRARSILNSTANT